MRRNREPRKRRVDREWRERCEMDPELDPDMFLVGTPHMRDDEMPELPADREIRFHGHGADRQVSYRDGGVRERTSPRRFLYLLPRTWANLSRREQGRILRAAYDSLTPRERERWEFMFRDSRKYFLLDDRPRRHRGFNTRCARRFFLKEGK